MSTCPECWEDTGCTCDERKEITRLQAQVEKLHSRLHFAIEMLARNTGEPFAEIWLTIADKANGEDS